MRALLIAVGSAAAAAIVGSIVDGPPRHVPDVALGWPPVLYIERAVLVGFLLFSAAALALGIRAGRTVSSIGGGPIPTVVLDDTVDADIEALARRMHDIEQRVEELDARRPER